MCLFLPIEASAELILALFHTNTERKALSWWILFREVLLHAVAESKTLSRQNLRESDADACCWVAIRMQVRIVSDQI